MRQLEYPTFVKYPGPWLIDFNQLEDLDCILDDEWHRLIEFKKSMVQEKVEKELQDLPEEERDQNRERIEQNARRSLTHYNEGKKVRVAFKSGKRLTTPSFKEMARDQSTRDDLPKDLSVFMACGEVSVSLEMDDYRTWNLTLNVAPSSSSVATEVFSVLERWVISVSAPLVAKTVAQIPGMAMDNFFPRTCVACGGPITEYRRPRNKIQLCHQA